MWKSVAEKTVFEVQSVTDSGGNCVIVIAEAF